MHIFNAIVDAFLSNRASALRADVGAFGGHCVFPFSQCQAPISTWLSSRASLHQTVNGGICSALSSYWMDHHARGSSLWNWLYPNGGLVPNAGRLNQIMATQAQGLAFGAGQAAFEDQWLSSHYLERRKNWSIGFAQQLGPNWVVNGNTVPTPAAAGASGFIAPTALADAIVNGIGMFAGTGSYRRITFASPLGAHAIAAYVGDDVCFFDPNFGEFWFDSRVTFRRWFLQKFWTQSSYAMILSGQWGATEYSRRHNAP